MPSLNQNLERVLVFQFSILFDSVSEISPDLEPTRSGAEGIEPLKPLTCGFSLDSMLEEAKFCAGAWNGFQQVQLISDEKRGGHWKTKGWRAARCHMAGEGHGGDSYVSSGRVGLRSTCGSLCCPLDPCWPL